ncbi:sugar phosphate isomerase/epimerase [soil metagenome]
MAAVPAPIPISLSTSSVYPGTTASGFEAAKRLGYDGVEVMVGIDSVSADIAQVKSLSEFHEIPIHAIHAPCLLVTQRVWGIEPWGKLIKSAEMAHEVGADTVVVHPPFRWQRDYARGFVQGIADLEKETDMVFAVENMYPWRTGQREFQAYAPGWDPVVQDYAHVTLDLSHSSTAQGDPVQMAKDLGGRLAHIHMADGAGSAKDEHMIPGRGTQPCQEFLEQAAAQGFKGHIVVEINTRKAADQLAREADLLEALAFIRLHFDG